MCTTYIVTTRIVASISVFSVVHTSGKELWRERNGRHRVRLVCVAVGSVGDGVSDVLLSNDSLCVCVGLWDKRTNER